MFWKTKVALKTLQNVLLLAKSCILTCKNNSMIKIEVTRFVFDWKTRTFLQSYAVAMVTFLRYDNNHNLFTNNWAFVWLQYYGINWKWVVALIHQKRSAEKLWKPLWASLSLVTCYVLVGLKPGRRFSCGSIIILFVAILKSIKIYWHLILHWDVNHLAQVCQEMLWCAIMRGWVEIRTQLNSPLWYVRSYSNDSKTIKVM